MFISADKLKNVINKQIEQGIKRQLKESLYGKITCWVGLSTTSSSPNTIVSVVLERETSSTPIDFLNKTGETISVGDKCYIVGVGGNSLSNSFVAWKI